MSLLKKSGMRLAAVAAAVGLALGGALMASPAYASPEDPVKPALTAPSGPLQPGTTVTFEGTGEPGGSLFVRYGLYGGSMMDHLNNPDATLFVQIDANGNWSFPMNVQDEPGDSMAYTWVPYAEDAATVEANFDGNSVKNLTSLFPSSTRFSSIANQAVDVPIIAPIVGGAAALVSLAGLGFVGLRRKQIA